MKKLSRDLNEAEQQIFAEEFYLLCPFDDTESSAPFGCPWIWDETCILEGATIEEMAANFFKINEAWITELQKENEELTNEEN
jgi:hypothetical protein